MIEERVFFSSEANRLEGLLYDVPGNRGVVITHPHSLYGGDMLNNVVEMLAQVYQQEEYTTLRFNFRGVGGSAGKYGHGLGEQEDLRAAVRYLLKKGKTIIDLTGYSFGAWINALAELEERTVQRMIMVSPPVVFLDFRSISSLPSLGLVITGDHDTFAPPDAIEPLLPQWNPKARMEIIKDADHFYNGCTIRLASVLATYLKSG